MHIMQEEREKRESDKGILLKESSFPQFHYFAFEFTAPVSYVILLGSPRHSTICVLYSFICAFSTGNNLSPQTA